MADSCRLCGRGTTCTDQLRFEAASIKPSGPQSARGSNGGPGTSDSQLYTFGRVTLEDMLAIADEVKSFQISCKLALDKDEFDLAARMPPETTKPQFRSMLQNLLADRFHLKLHVISKEFPSHALVIAKGGPKFQASWSRDPQPSQFSVDGFPEVATNRPDIEASFSPARASN
ncbi:MAG TPA: TIGR03435 family protein [Bryobacteraceae bacterium]|nr:TIGR03435 family protein [Bryobacteraceae bacterium]